MVEGKIIGEVFDICTENWMLRDMHQDAEDTSARGDGEGREQLLLGRSYHLFTGDGDLL